MALHDIGVEKNYQALVDSLEDGYWDAVFKEKSYFLNQTEPHIEPLDEKGREVGEFDYLAVNLQDKTFLYGEVKSKPGDLSYAEDQLDRAENFFEEHGWTMIRQTFLER